MTQESIAIVALSAAVIILFIMLWMQARRNAEARTERMIDDLHQTVGGIRNEILQRISNVERDFGDRIAESERSRSKAE